MTYEEKYNYWELISDYDIVTAQAMITAERWMYVATICYTALARLIKGLLVYYTRKEAPKSDNLIFLINKLAGNPHFAASAAGIRFLAEKNAYFDKIADVTYYHITDYPFSYQKIMDRFIEAETARTVYADTCEILSWLKSFRPSEAPPHTMT